MPRHAAPRWERRSGRWMAALGEPSPRTGKATMVILRDEAGRPVLERDVAGAHAAFARLLAERQAALERASGITVLELARRYVTWHAEERRSEPRTVAIHLDHLNRFCGFERGGLTLGERPARSLEVADLTAYRKSMEARGCQSGYTRLAYASVLACWRWAARPVEGREPPRLLECNPLDGLARPRKGKGRRLVLAPATVAALVALAYARAEEPAGADWPRNRKVAWNRTRRARRLRALALRLVAESGCRPKEAATLRWEWVDEAERWAVIPQEYTKTKKEDRVLILSPGAAAELAALRAEAADPVHVFAIDRGIVPSVKQLGCWFAGFRRVAQAAGIAVPDGATLYTLRHSFVSNAASQGIDFRQLAPGMGHSAEVSERTYFHAQRSNIRGMMDRAREAAEGGGSGGE